jgi:6-phosphogluconolactonase
MQEQLSTLYIGTYTKGGSEGIYLFDFDKKNKSCDLKQIIRTQNPSYIALNENRNKMYAVNESSDLTGDMVSSFQLNSNSWEPCNIMATKGIDPCHLSLDHNNQHLFTSNYSNGSLSVFALDASGLPSKLVQFFDYKGMGPNSQRQETAHIHCARLSPDGRYLLVSDLGSDQVYTYKYDASNPTPLTLRETIKVIPGAGPRHILFNKSGTIVYLILELNATINIYNHLDGTLQLIQTIEMEAPSFKGENCAADIHLSQDEKFLYASNRGNSNTITVFSVSEISGELSFIERISSEGHGPRNFLITPCDNYLLIANQYTNDIQLFERNKTSGSLKHIKKLIDIDSPVCLKM